MQTVCPAIHWWSHNLYDIHQKTEHTIAGAAILSVIFMNCLYCILSVTWLPNNACARVAQSVCCLTTDWTAGVRSLTEAEDFSSSLCAQTGSGTQPASYTVGTGGSFHGGKAQMGCDADHSPPSSAKVKKE
jgi:hypothetical protein